MYFKNRAEAGRQLVAKLRKFDNQQCAVIALNSGPVVVAAQIAITLHANLMVLMSEDIVLPGEHDPLAAMTTSTFTYNQSLSSGQVDEYVNEYHGLIDEQRVAKFRKLNSLLSNGGEIDPKFLRHHV